MEDKHIPILGYWKWLGLDSNSIQALKWNAGLREYVLRNYRRSWKHKPPVQIVQELIKKYKK